MSDISTLRESLKAKDIKFVDFRFTDLKGTWHHVGMLTDAVSDEILEDGLMFDGSSIPGWKAINESDMKLRPDLKSGFVDPFSAQPQMVILCDVLEPQTDEPYTRDPRSILGKALVRLQASGVADTCYVGPEAEFFIFDSVRFANHSQHTFHLIESEDLSSSSEIAYDAGNMGHRPAVKGGYFPVPPVDSASDLRAEMLTVMSEIGLAAEKHHHEVAASQHELGISFAPLLQSADWLQAYKYVVHNVAHSYGKTATFMPKPIKEDNGSGMHVHISLWKDKEPIFAGNRYAGLSETALHFIAGIIKHARAINAFTNPTTNSYKRLIPGFEAPVLLAYSARNRSAACRIPHGSGRASRRVEVRFPDATCNPYLGFSALMLAGLDGIEKRLSPGEAMDKDLYDLPPEELKGIPTVCGSLRDALTSLEEDHDFLLTGDVFERDMLEAYAALRWQEVYALEHAPHPVEFALYYSA